MSQINKKRITTNKFSIGAYLIKRLKDYGIRHVFGIPGDYVLDFYDMLDKSTIKLVGTAKEDGAGFASDAYARLNGIGACCVTYCVGGFNVVNPIAGAYAEKSPVIVITGSPALNKRVKDPMLHHKVRNFSTQKDIFSHITAAAVVLDDEQTAFQKIDDTLATCWKSKRPVYIELPADMVKVTPKYPYRHGCIEEKSDMAVLREALKEAISMINNSKKPAILAGVEVHRYGLAAELTKLMDKTGIPVAVTILGKSVISEMKPGYLGVYEGTMGRPVVQRYIESSDCLLMLGTFLTDVNMGFSYKLDRSRTIEATSEKVQIQHHTFRDILFPDFVKGLLKSSLKKRAIKVSCLPMKPNLSPRTSKQPIKAIQFFQRLNDLLEDNMVVICDIGLCLFGAIDLVMHKQLEFIAPAYYTSMGFAVPACLGANLAAPKLRPIVLVGDGAFQMTGMELTSIVRQKLAPIIIVLNNKGYTTERYIKQGSYNDIQDWNYEKIPEVIGDGWGTKVHTETEFVQAWHQACSNTKSFSILNIQLDPLDNCPALERLGEKLSSMNNT
ncbi:MAG: alpha-keto acid decarboxylase family protein [Candidatus Anammoxibacter sp.]